MRNNTETDQNMPLEGAPRVQTKRIHYGLEPRQYGVLYMPGGPCPLNPSEKPSDTPDTSATSDNPDISTGSSISKLSSQPDSLHPSSPCPLVVVIHGGAWLSQYTLESTNDLCEAFAKAGIASWNLEYRCIGNAGGGYPGTFLDIAAGIDCVRELNSHLGTNQSIDLNKVVIVGHSAGGHLAVWAGSRSHIPATHPLALFQPLASPQSVTSSQSIEPSDFLSVKGVISLAGVLDLKEAAESKLGGDIVYQLLNSPTPDSLYPLVSPQAMLPPDVPVVLFHGTADAEVPLSISQTYALKAGEKGGKAEFIPIENADHFIFTLPHGKVWEALLSATKKLMEAEK